MPGWRLRGSDWSGSRRLARCAPGRTPGRPASARMATRERIPRPPHPSGAGLAVCTLSSEGLVAHGGSHAESVLAARAGTGLVAGVEQRHQAPGGRDDRPGAVHLQDDDVASGAKHIVVVRRWVLRHAVDDDDGTDHGIQPQRTILDSLQYRFVTLLVRRGGVEVALSR